MSRMIPPAVCKAGIVTPSWRSSGPPASVAAKRMAVAINVARTAIAPPQALDDRRQRREHHRRLDRADGGEECREAGESGFKHRGRASE